MSKTPNQIIEHLKALGLGSTQRSKVMETFRDAGEAEALEQAAGYLQQERREIAGSKAAANALFGMKI